MMETGSLRTGSREACDESLWGFRGRSLGAAEFQPRNRRLAASGDQSVLRSRLDINGEGKNGLQRRLSSSFESAMGRSSDDSG